MIRQLRRRFGSAAGPIPVFYNVFSSLEEHKLIDYFSNSIFNRKKYEGDHWDDVIHKYKETELIGYSQKVIFTYYTLILSLTAAKILWQRIPEDIFDIIDSLEKLIKAKHNLANRKLLVRTIMFTHSAAH